MINYYHALGMDTSTQHMTAICNRLDVNFRLDGIPTGPRTALYDWIAHLDERRRTWRASLLAVQDSPLPSTSLSERMLKLDHEEERGDVVMNTNSIVRPISPPWLPSLSIALLSQV